MPQRSEQLSEYRVGNDLAVVSSATDDPRATWDQVRRNPAYTEGVAGLGASDLIVDVGAHVGMASLLFAERVPGARVLAFEPAPASFRCLAVNLERHVPNGAAIRAAVGAVSEVAELTYYPYRPTMSTLHVDDADDRRNVDAVFDGMAAGVPPDVGAAIRREFWRTAHLGAARQTVPVTTLAEALADVTFDEIGLLKIDVERAELDVLRGVSDDLWLRIRRIAIEVHDLDGRLREIVELLERRNHRTRIFQEDLFSGGSVSMLLAERTQRVPVRVTGPVTPWPPGR